MPGTTRRLVAGPLSVELDDGGLRYLRLGAREVLRRLYVAVRDRHWGTVPIEISGLAVHEGPNDFDVGFTADHREGPIHFRWRGRIRGEADGTITYRMDGEALTSFVKNRIGVCVLHPIEECAGVPCRVEHGDGRVTEGAFPRLIAPHQPFLDIAALGHEVVPGVRAEVRFQGEAFEMEDQRNWSDDSYKTYSTPLALPRPVEIAAGTRISHEVTVRLLGAAAPAAAERGAAGATTFSYDTARSRRLPALGVALSPGAEPVPAAELDLLRALRLGHLRVDLVAGREDAAPLLERAAAAGAALDLPLEVAVVVGAEAAEVEAHFARLAAWIAAEKPPLASVLVLPAAGEVTPPEALRAARAALRAVKIGARVGGGTNVYFTEVNRNRGVVEGADLLVFTNSPQIHMDDDATLVENVAPLRWIAETARSFADGRPLALSPVTFKVPPRARPVVGSAASGGVPAHADRRQPTLFGAAWTAAHLGAAARAGFDRVTYFESSGPLGLGPGAAGPAWPAPFGASPGSVYPLYHALADLGDFAGGEVLDSHSARPLALNGFVLRRGDRLRVVVANLGPEDLAVRIDPAPARAEIRRLNGDSAAEASRAPAAFRARVEPWSGGELTLAAHEIATIDVPPR
jgi:hypothetical protein